MSTDRRHVSWLLWLWWVAAGAIGGGMGGLVAAPLMTIRDSDWALVANSYAYLIVSAVVTGVLQWLLLRPYIRAAVWWATVTGASQVIGLQSAGSIFYFVAIVFQLDLYAAINTDNSPPWFLIGTVVGLVQWLVLRQQVPRAAWWILASAASWALFGFVLRNVDAALAGIITGLLGGALGALVVIALMRQRLSHSVLWVLAAIVGWALSWLLAYIATDASWQQGHGVLSGVIGGATLSAIPGVVLVLLLRRPIATNPRPFEWRLWLRWVLFSAGSAALIGLVLGIVIRFLERTIEEEPLLGQGVFLLLLFTATAMAIGAIQWQLLRQRLSLAGLWGLGSAVGFLVLGFLWLMQLGGSGALAFVAGGLVAGLIQWAPMRRSVPWGSRWILISTLGVALVGPVTILAATLLGTLATLLGAAIVSYAILGAIVAAGITSVTGMALIWLLQQPRPTLEEQERA